MLEVSASPFKRRSKTSLGEIRDREVDFSLNKEMI